jgi:HCOMODA/2-hydroxy-3-carboxy-muconic semialdehyde decarboxylase
MKGSELQKLDQRVRMAARALARHGLAQAWGHCSARIDTHSFLVCAPKPMGCVRSGDLGTVVDIVGPLPPGVLGEVRVHQQIYRQRLDVGGVCRVMPPLTMALSTQRIVPRARHGVGAFTASCAFWDDPRLLRDDAMAEALAQCLGSAPAVVMRGNGAVVVASSVEIAAGIAWCLEDAARVEHAVRGICIDTDLITLTAQEQTARQVTSGRVFERLWEFMTDGDPESPATAGVG